MQIDKQLDVIFEMDLDVRPYILSTFPPLCQASVSQLGSLFHIYACLVS